MLVVEIRFIMEMILISQMLILAGHSHIDKITGLAKCCYFMIYIWNYAFLFLCSIRFVSFPKIISYNVDSLIVNSPFRLQKCSVEDETIIKLCTS